MIGKAVREHRKKSEKILVTMPESARVVTKGSEWREVELGRKQTGGSSDQTN